MTKFSLDNPLWNFSNKFYKRDDVRSVCLALQDEFGFDINIVLYCCWMAVSGHPIIKTEELSEIVNTTRPWQNEVISDLRKVRIRMKSNNDIKFGDLSKALRDNIKDCELQAERIEQSILYYSGGKLVPRNNTSSIEAGSVVYKNLNTYANQMSVENMSALQNYLSILKEALIQYFDEN